MYQSNLGRIKEPMVDRYTILEKASCLGTEKILKHVMETDFLIVKASLMFIIESFIFK
jgi:hypothetical protein